MKLFKMIFLLAIMTFPMITFAGDYKQKIKLYVNPVQNNLIRYTQTDTCFTTTDFFDIRHCGDQTSNKYNHGPKHVRLKTSGHNISNRSTTDSSCSGFTTPKGDGTFEIYVTSEAKTNEYRDTYIVFTQCKTNWIPKA